MSCRGVLHGEVKHHEKQQAQESVLYLRRTCSRQAEGEGRTGTTAKAGVTQGGIDITPHKLHVQNKLQARAGSREDG